MKRILLILLLISPAMAVAQDESDDPYVECAEVLSSSPANRLVAMSEDGTYGKLEKLLRPRLFGKTCSVDQFIVYMLDAGWQLKGDGLSNYETPRESYYYTYDSAISFCLPERGLWRLFNRCGGNAVLFLLDEKVTWLVFVAPIRFGG